MEIHYNPIVVKRKNGWELKTLPSGVDGAVFATCSAMKDGVGPKPERVGPFPTIKEASEAALAVAEQQIIDDGR